MGFLTCSQYSNIIFSIANLILKGKSNIVMITLKKLLMFSIKLLMQNSELNKVFLFSCVH